MGATMTRMAWVFLVTAALALAACAGGVGGDEGEGDSGEGEGDGGGEGEGEGEGESGGTQGIFLTLNGVPLEATRPNQPGSPAGVGFVEDASFGDAYARVIVSAGEGADGEPWILYLPKETGTFVCGNGDDDHPARIAIPVGPGGRSAADSAILAEDCTLTITSMDPTGIIAGTFSGTLGGTAASQQDVTEGRFIFDNERGGGDCSDASDPGLGADEVGFTLSVTRLTVNSATPKYLKCGDNYTMAPGFFAYSAADGVTHPGGYYGGFSEAGARLDGWVDVGVPVDAIDVDAGTCSQVFFSGYQMSGAFVDPDHCTFAVTRNDETFLEGTYQATLSVTRDDGRAEIDIAGTFRVPPTFP